MKEEINKDEAGSFIQSLREQKINRFLDVGFTREQAEVLISELNNSSFGFNMF